MVAVVHRSKYIGWRRIGGGVFRSLLEPRARSLVHARGAPLMCRLHRVLANSLARASIVTRTPQRNWEIAFFLPPTLGMLQKVALPEKSRPFFRAVHRAASRHAAPRRRTLTLIRLKDQGGSEKREGARDGTSIMAARFEGSAARAENGVFARARKTICPLPLSDIRAASLSTRKETARNSSKCYLSSY